ncbi:MAG: glutamate 5-kinase [Bacteroidetes bacterium]|nr:MAG: glutamate 5-kinase [Bacteroidota bacterium]
MEQKPILVLKLGSSVLTNGTTRISRGKLEDVAHQISDLRTKYRIVLVSSGAIATARQFIDQSDWGEAVASKQAMSAIGQPKLMQMYYEVFNDYNLKIAQCLLTYRDFVNPVSKENTFNTIMELMNHHYVPVINENDTVAVDEIVLGDNDKLSAKVATLLKAKTLVLASDIDGLYDKNPHKHEDAQLVTDISDFSTIRQYIDEKTTGPGTGGMTSKLEAAEICAADNIETIIVNGRRDNFLVDCINGEIPFTRFAEGE